MEPARIETLLENGWSLIGQLHQWLSTWHRVHSDRDALVELISGLQSFWVKADDLNHKRIARNSLALEQFFERLCAKKLVVTSEHVKDVHVAVAGLEDLLLELEATGEEPPFSNFESLNRLERHVLQGYWSESAKRMIEVTAASNNRTLSIVRSDETEVHPSYLDVYPSQIPVAPILISEPNSISRSITHLSGPFLEQHEIEFAQTQEKSGEFIVERNQWSGGPGVSSLAAESNCVLIIEESLFYRHLIDLALKSAGYETETTMAVSNDANGTANESLTRYRAVVLTASASIALASKIQPLQTLSPLKVVGLKATECDESFHVSVDACVLKSQPQKLISVLNRLLSPITDHPQKIA